MNDDHKIYLMVNHLFIRKERIEMSLIFSQFICICGLAMFVVSMKQKSKEKVLVWQIISFMMYATQYLILGEYAGMAVYLLNAFRNVIIYIFEKKEKDINCVGFLFILISLYMAIVQYRNIYDILPACTSVVNIIFMMQKNVVKLKVGQIIASSIWIIYDIILQAYVAGVSEIIIVFAATSWIFENKYNCLITNDVEKVKNICEKYKIDFSIYDINNSGIEIIEEVM